MKPLHWNQVTAVLGGAFDPPHLGHRQIVRDLFQALGVPRVIVLPTASPPYKPVSASFANRIEMARLAFSPSSSDPNFPRNVIFDFQEETRHRSSGRASYTYDTLMQLQNQYPSIAFTIGADQLRDLPTWYRFPEVLDLAHWVVLQRMPDGQEVASEAIRVLQGSGLAERSDDLTWQVGKSKSKWLRLLPTQAPAISSTQIREKIARDGIPPEGSLLPEVWEYLKEHRVYGSQ